MCCAVSKLATSRTCQTNSAHSSDDYHDHDEETQQTTLSYHRLSHLVLRVCVRYGGNGNRNKSYTVADYYDDFASYMAQLHAAVPDLPMHFVQGADYCCDTAWEAELEQYTNRFTDELFRVGVHHYPVTKLSQLTHCTLRQPAEDAS